jgi:AGZA family xanthine/uracil permease-like MFS transporter
MTTHVFSAPPSLEPTAFKMDIVSALSPQMWPFIIVFLFMVFFDTVGTLVGVGNQAGLMRDGKLPRARQAFVSDAVGTVAGAALGTSTVTSFIESAAGVEQGGRTGLTALVAGLLFLGALFLSPVIAMVGSYSAITAPALVLVGSMMMGNVTRIRWDDFTEAFPAFLILLGIPLTYSIADGLGLGFISYTLLKLLGGRRKEVPWFMYLTSALLIVYFIFVRARIG